MKKLITVISTCLLATSVNASSLSGWSTADLCDVVNGSAGTSISSKYLKKLKGQTRWTSKEYKAIQRGKLFAGMSEDAMLCSMPNLELDFSDVFGSMYVLVTPRGEHLISTDMDKKVYMAPWSIVGM